MGLAAQWASESGDREADVGGEWRVVRGEWKQQREESGERGELNKRRRVVEGGAQWRVGGE